MGCEATSWAATLVVMALPSPGFAGISHRNTKFDSRPANAYALREGCLEVFVHVVGAETRHYDQQQNGQLPTRTNKGLQLVHLLLQLQLFLGHLIFAFTQKQLIVFVHGERTAVDEKNYQNQGDCAPQDEQHDDRRQSRHIHLDGFNLVPRTRRPCDTDRRGRYR